MHFDGPDGQQYSLVHLKAQKCEIKLKIDNEIYDVPAVLVFSNHCYTDNQNQDGTDVQEGDSWYCLSDDKGPRAFCQKRWKASLTLPEYLITMIKYELDCYKLNKAGFFIRIHDNDRDQKYAGWYVFFSFSPANDHGPGIVRISVTSHHHRKKLPDSVRSTVKFKFNSLLAQWFKDRPPHLAALKAMKKQAAAQEENIPLQETGT